MSVTWQPTGEKPKAPHPSTIITPLTKRAAICYGFPLPAVARATTNYSVPLVAVINGQRQLIGGNSDGGIYGFNARTGKPIWGFRMSRRGLNTSPVVDGNYVYIAHGEDNIDNNDFGRVQCIDASGSGDLTETGSVWRYDGLKAGYTGLVVKDGILYSRLGHWKLECLRQQNGFETLGA